MYSDFDSFVSEIEKRVSADRQGKSIHSIIGIELDKLSTAELLDFFVKQFGDLLIRDYAEQQIIYGTINAIKYRKEAHA